MPHFEFVEYTADPDTHVARITLNRPARLNALNDQMQREFTDAIASAESDDGVRVVIVTGAGRAFCAGGDLNDLGGSSDGTGAGWTSGNADEVRRSFRSAQAMILGVQRCEKPVIAMVNGVATGAGLDLACACDIRHRHRAIPIHVGLRTYRAVPRIRRNVVISANVGESWARRGDAFHRRFPGSR